MTDTKKSAKSTSADLLATMKSSAMRERAKEQKAAARRGADKADGERDVLAKIAEMPEPDRVMAKRLHELITGQRARPLAEDLVRDAGIRQATARSSATSPAADKFKSRYATFGFKEDANLDEGTMWPTSFGADEVDRRRRGKDRRPREEGGELRPALASRPWK